MRASHVCEMNCGAELCREVAHVQMVMIGAYGILFQKHMPINHAARDIDH